MRRRFLIILFISILSVSCERNDLFKISSNAGKKPADIPNIELWFEKNINFDSVTNIVHNWTDNINGTILDYTQASYPMAVMLPGGSRAIKFTASASLEHTASPAWGKTISQPYTIFTAVSIDYTMVSDTIFSGIGFDFNNYTNDGRIYFDAGGTASFWDGGLSINNMTYYCFSVESGNVDIFRNEFYETRLLNIGTGAITDIIFGGVNDHNFTIASYILYSRILTEEERNIVFFYLKNNVK